MEYCQGGDLHHYMKTSKLSVVPEAQVRRIVLHISAALRELCANRLFHRDIKPQNILLTSSILSDATFKLADFGFARHVLPSDLADTLCGSPLYMVCMQLVDFYGARHRRFFATKTTAQRSTCGLSGRSCTSCWSGVRLSRRQTTSICSRSSKAPSRLFRPPSAVTQGSSSWPCCRRTLEGAARLSAFLATRSLPAEEIRAHLKSGRGLARRRAALQDAASASTLMPRQANRHP